MRSATLTRAPSTDQGTFGRLVADSGFTCRTGELPDRDNEPDYSCVDEGVYLCILQPSAHFGVDLYHLQDTPGRTGVMIHAGNWCGDVKKGFRSDVKGCIIVGDRVAQLEGQIAILNSQHTLAALMEDLKGEPFMLTIKGEQP